MQSVKCPKCFTVNEIVYHKPVRLKGCGIICVNCGANVLIRNNGTITFTDFFKSMGLTGSFFSLQLTEK